MVHDIVLEKRGADSRGGWTLDGAWRLVAWWWCVEAYCVVGGRGEGIYIEGLVCTPANIHFGTLAH